MMGGESIHKAAVQTSIPRYSAGPVGQQIHSIYKGRLGQFTSNGQYKSGGLMGYVQQFEPLSDCTSGTLTPLPGLCTKDVPQARTT